MKPTDNNDRSQFLTPILFKGLLIVIGVNESSNHQEYLVGVVGRGSWGELGYFVMYVRMDEQQKLN